MTEFQNSLRMLVYEHTTRGASVSRVKTGKGSGVLRKNEGVRKEAARKASTSHGKRRTSEYTSWVLMKDRCTNPRNKCFKHYGGRGITFCDSWKGFPNFLEDMGEKPTPRHSLDRIDNEKGYFKENCRWATTMEQLGNRRVTVWVSFEGVKYRLKEACERAGISSKNFAAKVRKGTGVTYQQAFDETVARNLRAKGISALEQHITDLEAQNKKLGGVVLEMARALDDIRNTCSDWITVEDAGSLFDDNADLIAQLKQERGE